MTATEFTTTVRGLKELMNMREELEAEIAAAQNAIKTEMTARDTNEMKINVFKVTWKSVTQNRFDTTGFKAAHKDIYDLFTKATETRRFSIA
jgi:predicted phage-related endonuclease